MCAELFLLLAFDLRLITMHVYFAGIGAGTGPLALIAKQAGYTVSGSDKQVSSYTEHLKKYADIDINIGQSGSELEATHQNQPVDWLVYSSALPKENPNHPELLKAKELGIRTSKRDEFLNMLITDTGQKLVAIAGTHGKTTTTSMMVWLFKQLGIPVSYSVGAKLSFGEMGEFDPKSEYFVYEADEYDRNFLSFKPYLSIITGVAYDHQDVYPTKKDYDQAFVEFIDSSQIAVVWKEDKKGDLIYTAPKLEIECWESEVPNSLKLVGLVNRQNAWQVIEAFQALKVSEFVDDKLIEIMNRFPGLSRRFEKIRDNIYSDYAHTPEKILGALQTAHETAGDRVVVVYEGLHNTRQHFIKQQLENLFEGVKKLYIVPSYRAREDETLEDLTPAKLCELTKLPADREPAELNQELLDKISNHAIEGDLVLCLSAGGGGSLDEWLRKKLQA